jgi:hypothetical protein
MSEQKRAVRGATAWHPPFYDLVTQGAPPTTEVRTEVVLSQQPRRADMLLLRRKHEPPRDHEARVLRGLWPLLGSVALAELKGPTAGFRPADLLRLVGYGVQYHELNMQALTGPSALTLALITPAPTPTLRAAIEHMEGWRLEPLGSGYARIVGAWYSTIIAFIDEVCEAERDDYLRLFSRRKQTSIEAARWLFTYRSDNMENIQNLEGYEELMERVLSVLPPEEVMRHYKPEEVMRFYKPEERVAGLKPEEVMRHYKPEERVAGLPPEERVAGLPPEERLAGLTQEELAALRKYLDETSS